MPPATRSPSSACPAPLQSRRRSALQSNASPKTSRTKRCSSRSSPPTRSSPGSSARGRLARLTVSILIEPRHLDFFQGGFVGGLGVVGEAVELGDPAVQVGEADGQRVDVGKLFAERDPEVLGVLPRELHLGIST